MPRFCAVLTPHNSAAEVVAMGGAPVHRAPPCALGLLPDERPGAVAGPYAAGDLTAVGEVTLYNPRELRAELSWRAAPPPEGCSDGDLLLHYVARFGLEALARVNGKFALAIWDGAALTLARDPVGARTLFYTQVGACWAAASSLRALRRWPPLPARLNLAAVQAFLTFAYLPGELTLLDGVSELLPGCWLRLEPDGRRCLQRYWEIEEPPWETEEPPEHYRDQLRRLLETVIAAALPPGEEVGVFLSGGIDSSLVTALVARLHDRRVRTYAINFGAHLPNELAYSGLVAAHCGSTHRVLTFDGRQIAAGLAETVALLDCPVGDPLTVPNLLLARAAAADGLRTVFNGEGGDPCFGGPKNLPLFVFELLRSDPDPMARANAYLHSYRKCYAELPRLLSPAARRALAGAPPLEHLVLPHLEAPQMRSFLNRLLLTNVRTKGAHHILTKVERLTAACGLEGQSPLFNPAVVACAFAIPPALKLAAANEKWVLKQAARDLLPATIIDRPKSGMRVPVQHWLRGPLRDLALDLLLGPQAQARDLFQPATIRAWLQGDGSVWARQGGMLWIVLTLELWLRAYLDRAELTPDYFARRRLWRPGLPWR